MSSPREPQNELSPIKRAFLKIEELEARLEAVTRARTEPLAVIGAGCRFPGGVRRSREPLAAAVAAARMRPARTRRTAGTWKLTLIPSRASPARCIPTRGGFLAEVDGFDPQFFGIAPREAAGIDPAAAAAAGSGVGGARARRAVARAAARQPNGRLHRPGDQRLCPSPDQARRPDAILDAYFSSGTARGVASGRLSYVLGLNGPAISVDTALLFVAGGAPPGLPGTSRRRVRPGGGRGRPLDPVAGQRHLDVPVADDGRRRTVQDL